MAISSCLGRTHRRFLHPLHSKCYGSLVGSIQWEEPLVLLRPKHRYGGTHTKVDSPRVFVEAWPEAILMAPIDLGTFFVDS